MFFTVYYSLSCKCCLSELLTVLLTKLVLYILHPICNVLFLSCLYFCKMNVIINAYMIDSWRESGQLFRYSDWATGWTTKE